MTEPRGRGVEDRDHSRRDGECGPDADLIAGAGIIFRLLRFATMPAVVATAWTEGAESLLVALAMADVVYSRLDFVVISSVRKVTVEADHILVPKHSAVGL